VKKILLFTVFTGLGILFTITSCTNNNKPQKTEFDSLSVKAEKTANGFGATFSAPSPRELFILFEDSDIKFNSELLPEPESYKNSLTTKSLNNSLGIYIADIAYLNMFNQYGLMTSYLESVFNIADELDLTGIYNEFDFKKIFKNMDNMDSLEVLSDDLYLTITNFMTETDNEANLCLVYYSSYIELLYLVLSPMDEYDKNSPTLQHIAMQGDGLKELYKYASNFNDNPDIESMLTDLAKINKIWDSAETTKKATHVSKTDDGKMSIGGGVTYKHTKEQFILLKHTVIDIRTKLIN